MAVIAAIAAVSTAETRAMRNTNCSDPTRRMQHVSATGLFADRCATPGIPGSQSRHRTSRAYVLLSPRPAQTLIATTALGAAGNARRVPCCLRCSSGYRAGSAILRVDLM